MLQQSRLLANLREFSQPDQSTFREFPPAREQARQEWAQAFADYASAIEEDILRPPPPPDAHPSLELSGVEDAFFADLGLDDTMSAADAALDFAGAWQQGILAITATSAGATDSASSIYKFLSFTNVSTLHDTLRDQLEALFLAPSAESEARLDELATAFHAATSGLKASMNVTVGSTTSGKVISVR